MEKFRHVTITVQDGRVVNIDFNIDSSAAAGHLNQTKDRCKRELGAALGASLPGDYDACGFFAILLR
ncbi:MAG: YezD family protein [Holosporales bacterium]|nr:YezD family protein [Holosporales bacterium]